MGKDVKKRFTVSLDIETKDVEKQVKATVGNLKTILADLGKASDKMSYFKELVDYIGQIDTALTALKNKNKDAFNHMFDGLDADLKKVMESIFDTSGKSMSVLDNLRNRLNDASKNGAGVKELRQIAAEINTLFTSLGRAEPIDIDAQFSGRGKTEDRIKLLTDALDNFATVWDGVHNKVKNGFGFEGTGGVVEFSEKVQKEIDVLEDKIKSIQNLMTELQNVFKMTKAFSDGKDVSLGFEATEESAKNLLEQFKLLSATRQKFLEDGDTSSSAYYENLIQYTKAATQLVVLNDELAKSSKGSPKFLANALSGEFVDVYDFIESFDKKFVSSIQTSLNKIVSDAQTGIDKIKADALKNMSPSTTQGTGRPDGGNDPDGKVKKNKELSNSYEELAKKIKEYAVAQEYINNGLETDDDGVDLEEKIRKLDEFFLSLDKVGDKAKEIRDILGDLSFGDIGPNKALEKLSALLQIKKESDVADGSPVGSGTSTTSGSKSGGTITNVDFTSLENTIKAEIASIANKLDSVFKVEVVKNDTEDIKNAIDGVKSTIEKISAEIDSYNTLKKTDAHQAEVNAMKNNLTQLFKFISEFNNKQLNGQYQDQEISAAILSDGSISTGYGEGGTVPWDRMASALVGNLTKSLMVDVHSHPWAQNAFLDKYANDSFSGAKGDLGAFRISKELGAQMAAMITGNIMRTLDISKLTDDQMKRFRKSLYDIEKNYANSPEYSKYMEYKNDKLYYHSQSTLAEQHKVTEAFESLMYKAFKEIGFSKDKVDKEIFKKYDLTDDAQLTELAERLVHLSQSSQNALSPVERLSEIISHFSGDVNSKTAKENFEAFTKGELTAAEVFNNLNRDGHTLNQETLDSLYKIDSANEMPVVESLLTQVVSALNAIESSVVNINNNTRQSTRDQFDTAINDILDIREGVNNKNILAGIKSIFDPLNISEYKNNEVLQIADGSILDAKDYIQDLFVKSHSEGSVSLDEMQIALDKFYLAMSNIQDAIKQVDLYEERTGKTHIDNAGEIAKYTLNDKYKEITDDNLLQQLLYLLSQAKVDISKSKEFYQGGFGGKQTDYDDGQVASILQSVKSILDSIYGVLHGFTGIEADNKNALKYKEPVVDTGINRKEFSEQDLSVLNSILQVLQGIDGYLSTNKSDDVTEKDIKDNTDISELVSFIRSKLSQQLATEDTLQSIKGAIEQIAELARSKDESKKDDGEDLTQSLNTLINALTSNVTTLKDVANGIVQHQKAQKSDTTKAMSRIQDPKQNQIVSGLAKDAVKTLGAEVEIESLQALANGVVKVEGAFKNANDQWEGFTVKINEHNEAVDLAVKKHSALANTLNKAKDIDENTYQYNKEEVEARAQKHLEEYAAQGKNATVQFKDSGRYTITILEEIDGLSKQIFQTFDENDKKIERTTVTMSNSQKLKLENLQKKLIDNGLTNGLISDKDNEYKNYQAAADALSNMTNAYSQMDNISDVEIANWKQQIALVQQLGNQVSDLIKQRKLANDQKVFESDRSKKLSKFDLDKATLQKDIAIPDSFNQRIGDTRTAIENAIDADSLKIAINNWEALQNEIKQTAIEQDLYNKKTKAPKQKTDEFTKNLSKQSTDFAKYKTDIQNALGVTDELREKLNGLETDLDAIGDATGLDAWIQRLKSLKTEISNAQKGFKASQIAVSSDIAGKANSKFKELNFKATDNNLTQEQEEIVNKRKELLQQIKEYNIAVNSGQKVEIDGIKKTRDELYELINTYKTAHNIASGNTRANRGQAYGLNQLQNFTARYNSLMSGASDIGLDSQATVVLNLTNAYKQLQVAQSAFVAGEDKTSAVYAQKVEVFKAAQLACNNYARELNRVVNSSKKLEAESGGLGSPLDEDFKDDFKGREAALRDFVNTTYGSKAAIEGFDNSFNKLNFTVKNSDGTFTKMTATINEARTAIYATAGATEKATGKFGKFINELGGKFKSISTYFMASFGIEEVWQQLRQGAQYVREIDSALTELKKVTNETDASYDRFLQSMSKTGSVIGATVQDLTTMAADWARLGYSMQEAGKLAESTAILLNVSEFQDANAASEALISTMQAFKYTADESGHVVDILNEVGNNYAVSSDGLAIALQDSASALMEAGNNLEQSVALVAAANRVVQDPNSVGGALRTISLRLRGTSVEVLEEIGEETDGVVESASKMQEKIRALTGVDIVDMNGAYKDTYTILQEIGSVWSTMSDMDKAATLELMAGKNRANTLSAILSNMKDLKGAYESALDAEGSALRENEAYLDSIQGRIDLFNNSLQTMWMNFLDSEVVKFIVDIGTAFIKAADAVGVLESALFAVMTYLNLSSKSNFDLASMLGIHKKGDSFIDGFSAFGKEGLTGWVASKIRKSEADEPKSKENIAQSALGNTSEISTQPIQQSATKAADTVVESIAQAVDDSVQAVSAPTIPTQPMQEVANTIADVGAKAAADAANAIPTPTVPVQPIQQATAHIAETAIEAGVNAATSANHTQMIPASGLSKKKEKLEWVFDSNAPGNAYLLPLEDNVKTHEYSFMTNDDDSIDLDLEEHKGFYQSSKQLEENLNLLYDFVVDGKKVDHIPSGYYSYDDIDIMRKPTARRIDGGNYLPTSKGEMHLYTMSEAGEAAKQAAIELKNLQQQRDEVLSDTVTSTSVVSPEDFFGDPSDFQDAAKDYAEVITDTISIDPSDIDQQIAQVEKKLIDASTEFSQTRQKLLDLQSAGEPTDDVEKHLDELMQQLGEYNAEYDSLTKQRNEMSKEVLQPKDDLVPPSTDGILDGYKEVREEASALQDDLQELNQQTVESLSVPNAPAVNIESGAVAQIQQETDAYKNMLSVLGEVQNVKLSMGSEQYAAKAIDEISKAAGEGQEALAGYLASLDASDATLGDANLALKAYAASVQDGNYSLAGFQQFIAQHNAGVKASGIAAKAAAIGHELLNAALSTGVTMFASFVLEKVITGLDNLVHAAEKAAEAADELNNTYSSTVEEVNRNLGTLGVTAEADSIEALEKDFKRLANGVDRYGNNISLTSDEYDRYKQICEQIVGINPQIASGYDSATEAIGNNAGVLSQLIELQKEQMRLAAQEYISDENLEILSKDAVNDFKDATQEVGKVSENLRGQLNSFFVDIAGNDSKDVMQYVLEKLGHDSADIQRTIEGFWDYDAGTYDVGKFWLSYSDDVKNNIDKFGAEYFNDLSRIFKNADAEFAVVEASLKKAQDGLIDTLLIAPVSSSNYDKLTSQGKNFLLDWIKNSDMFKVNGEVDDEDVKKMRDTILNMMDILVNDAKNIEYNGEKFTAQEILDKIYNLDTSIDFAKYKDQLSGILQAFWNSLSDTQKKDYGFEKFEDFQIALGFDFVTDEDTESKMISRYAKIKGITEEQARDYFNSLPAVVVKRLLAVDWNTVDSSNVDSTIEGAKVDPFNTISSKTYSELSASVESYNEILSQTSEIVSDNTEVTQEYKDSLSDLGIAEEDIADCFDENNKLVVKNAALLNKLVKQKKQDQKATVQQSKAYGQLQYKTIVSRIQQLVNKMATEVKATGYVSTATLNHIGVLRQQLVAIKQTIQQYALLELSLSDAANAYSEFEAAKGRDAQLTYGDSMVEMLNAINEGFKTGKVGSEAFQAAVKALVPESVYKDIDDLQERMQAIHDYVDKNPIFADYFTIDEGQISITIDNIKAFLQDGLDLGVFLGDLNDFDFAPHIQSVKDLADTYGITEAAALAMLTEFEKYDASWGDIITRLTTTELDRNINDATDALEEAITAQEEFIKSGQPLYDENGKMTAGYKAVVEAVNNARDSLDNATQAAIDNAQTCAQVEAVLKGMSGEMKYTQEQADALARSLGLINENGHITINAETGALELTNEQVDILNQKLTGLKEPTILDIQLASDKIDYQIQELQKKLEGKEYDQQVIIDLGMKDTDDVQGKIDELTATQKSIELVYSITPSTEQNDSNLEKLGEWEANGVNITVRAVTTELDADVEKVNAIEMDEKPVKMTTNEEEINEKIDTVTNNNPPDKTVNLAMAGVSYAIDEVTSLGDALDNLEGTRYVTIAVEYDNKNGITQNANGNFHISGGAFASGTVGAPKTETSLVGELGPELIVDPSTGRWHTVGDRGAEFTQVKRGQIIFNHLQTKQLLENGYVTSRGRLQGGNSAFASGTAYGYGIYDGYVGSGDAVKNGSDKWVNPGENAIDNAADDISDAADDIVDNAEQVVDFIEMKLEEIEATIEKTSSKIANSLDDTTSIKSKDQLYDRLVQAEKDKAKTYSKAAQKYDLKAESALSRVPEKYRDKARNGAIDIKDFVGEDQVAVAEAIQEYRDWAAKADEAENGHLEAIAAISAYRVEQLEDIASDFENIISISKSHSDLLQAEMDYVEESGNRLSESYYEELKKNSQSQLNDLQNERSALQKILDDAVASGDVAVGSDDWYAMVNAINEVDKEIIDCKTEMEAFQNAINELYWDNFDKFIDEIDNVNSELSNLQNLISDADMVDEMGNWTDEGITSLGLLAQQMENAQFKSQQYGEAIAKLKKDYAAGLYSTDEYNERLADLTDSQYDAIQSYEDAKDAIVNLNQTRAEAVKKYMQDEIDKYSELIEKKKEALSKDKEAYDFQKQVQESNENIEDIERKIAALAGNTSSSAIAQRKRLEAELLKAKEEQEELYYNHSIEKQQEALDKELEDYTKNKEDQMDALDEYLKNEEQVVADSFDLIAKNAETVASTLTRISEEYGVTISDTVATPWVNGANAIGTYEEQLNTSTSATTKNLNIIKKNLEDLQAQADATAQSVINSTRTTVSNTTGGQQTSTRGYAKGSKSIEHDQWAIVDELGDELQLVPNKAGRLDYIKKGTGILNNTLTERLMDLAMDPTSMLENSRPVIGAPGITTTNNTFAIDASVGTLLHVEHLDGSNPAEVAKLVDKAWEKKMQTLNNSIKKFTR